jgi:hypothetical protein
MTNPIGVLGWNLPVPARKFKLTIKRMPITTNVLNGIKFLSELFTSDSS